MSHVQLISAFNDIKEEQYFVNKRRSALQKVD